MNLLMQILPVSPWGVGSAIIGAKVDNREVGMQGGAGEAPASEER